MASLHEAGWHQGTIFDAQVPTVVVVLGDGAALDRRQRMHGRWAVVSQECDLAGTDEADNEPTVELRPVHRDDPPSDWGLRSRQLRLNDQDYLEADDARTMISAAALTALCARHEDRVSPTPEQSRRLAIWLGYRYDRPALPEELVPLGRRIATEARKKPGRDAAMKIRDVLMQFDTDQAPPRFSLFALIEDEDDESVAREWLAAVANRVPVDLGIADELEAVTADRLSLDVIEQSYAADVKQLTWRPDHPDPVGA